MNKVKRLEPELISRAPSGMIVAVMRMAAGLRNVESIAARLKATREALGLRPAEFADRAGVARNTYSQWESAKSRPELDKAFLICDEYGLTLDWIYLGDPQALPHELALKILRKAG